MTDYKELIEALRNCADANPCDKPCKYSSEMYCTETLMQDAADAIEELLTECENLHELWQMAEGDKKELRNRRVADEQHFYA